MVTKTIVEKVYPSEGLLIPCAMVVIKDEVYVEDIYINKDRYEKNGDDCRSRMQKIIDWYKDARSQPK